MKAKQVFGNVETGIVEGSIPTQIEALGGEEISENNLPTEIYSQIEADLTRAINDSETYYFYEWNFNGKHFFMTVIAGSVKNWMVD